MVVAGRPARKTEVDDSELESRLITELASGSGVRDAAAAVAGAARSAPQAGL